jgi:hypothetical protein
MKMETCAACGQQEPLIVNPLTLKQECATCCRCEGRLMVRRVELDTVQGFEIHYVTTYSNEAALRRLWREDVEEGLVWPVVTWSREKPHED